MNTLYDLLGALPHDDAESLRRAFRNAVKGAHPDLRPDDPEAALKFREIVRANEILGDPEQRAAYDHLLGLAHEEQVSVSKQAVFVRVHRFASGVMAFAGISIATAGGYLLFMHMSAASVAPLEDADIVQADIVQAAPPEIKAVSHTVLSDKVDNYVSPTKPENPGVPAEAAASPATTPKIRTESLAPVNIGPAPDLAAAEARSLRARGMSALHRGDLNGAIADLDQALQLDPRFLPAYIDRGTILYRVRKLGRAFADVAAASRTEEADRAKSSSTAATGKKPHVDPAPRTASLSPPPWRRDASQNPAQEQTYQSFWAR
jgi:curved DNA-binding protein CbpA